MSILLPLDAKHYMKNSSSQYSQATGLLELVNINQNSSILDVGCGHGHIIAELSYMIPQGKATGIDASEEMILLAKEAFQNESYKNLQFFHMNAETMKFPPSTFDLIVCTNVLMWIRKPKKALALMISCLRSSGSIVIFTYPTTTAYVALFEEVLKELFPNLKDKSAVNAMLTPNQHQEIIHNYGLKTTLFEIDDIIFYYESEDNFRNYVRGWLVCYAPLTEKQQELFLDMLCKKALKKGYILSNGRIAIPHQTLRIVATKKHLE